MFKVLLVDDQVLFREGLHRVFNDWSDFDVIGEASNGMEALEFCKLLLPDIALMDIHMPVMNGVEAARRIRKELPSVRVVMLTVSDDEKDLFEAIKNGAQGYILKDTPARRLHSQLKGVMEDDAPLSGPIAAKMLAEFRQMKPDGGSGWDELMGEALEPLTEREVEILKLVAEGQSNTEIAKKLVVTEQTVKKHLHNILQKLQLNNRVQAAVYAVRSGLVK
jgi:DNA-binding NarL/FixJ family response regulator